MPHSERGYVDKEQSSCHAKTNVSCLFGDLTVQLFATLFYAISLPILRIKSTMVLFCMTKVPICLA
jgi:hypothetical protein